MSKCLFITWDGPQVSYLDGLFLPIFQGLGDHGHKFHVLQFTWGSNQRVAATEALCRDAGIPYRSIGISRRFGAIGPLMTAVWGAKHIGSAVRDWNIDTLMPRSLMPALSTLSMRDREGLRIIFDADGFAIDERVDFAGLSPRSVKYRIMRDIEAQIVRVADAVLTRTDAAIPILQARAGSGTSSFKYHVVTNGRPVTPLNFDKDLYLKRGGPVIGYIGSIGPQYMPKLMLDVAVSIKNRHKNLTFNIFSADKDFMKKTLQIYGLEDCEWISIKRLAPHEVTHFLPMCDIGMAFRLREFSTQGISPIKLGDYLLSGVPILGTPDIGNTKPLVDSGVFLPSDGGNISEIIDWFEHSVINDRDRVRATCRTIGEDLYSVSGSIDRYLRVFNAVMGV